MSYATTPTYFPTTPSQTKTTTAKVTVVNIIASVQLAVPGGELDLQFLAKTCRNIEYNPSKISCAFLRLPKLQTTGVIFRNGRIIVSGVRNEVTARLVTRYVARYIQTIAGYPSLCYTNFQILNFHCTFSTHFFIDIKNFISLVGAPKAQVNGDNVNLCFYRHSSDVTMMVGHTGKVMIKTASREVALQALKSIYPVLVKCRLATGVGRTG